MLNHHQAGTLSSQILVITLTKRPTAITAIRALQKDMLQGYQFTILTA